VPLQTNLEDLQEKLTGIGIASQAVGLEDHRAMLAATRRRTREGYEAMAKAAGLEPIRGDDDMGDLIITGDIQQSQEHKNGGTGKLIGAALAGAGIPLLFAAGYWLAGKPDTPTSTNPNTDTSSTIRPDNTNGQ
jgi:hypothetical protein